MKLQSLGVMFCISIHCSFVAAPFSSLVLIKWSWKTVSEVGEVDVFCDRSRISEKSVTLGRLVLGNITSFFTTFGFLSTVEWDCFANWEKANCNMVEGFTRECFECLLDLRPCSVCLLPDGHYVSFPLIQKHSNGNKQGLPKVKRLQGSMCTSKSDWPKAPEEIIHSWAPALTGWDACSAWGTKVRQACAWHQGSLLTYR